MSFSGFDKFIPINLTDNGPSVVHLSVSWINKLARVNFQLVVKLSHCLLNINFSYTGLSLLQT